MIVKCDTKEINTNCMDALLFLAGLLDAKALLNFKMAIKGAREHPVYFSVDPITEDEAGGPQVKNVNEALVFYNTALTNYPEAGDAPFRNAVFLKVLCECTRR